MFQKKYFMVFDCEGTKDEAFFGSGKEDKNQLPYDLSGVIIDRQGNHVERFAYACKEVLANGELMSSAYYGHKVPEYYDRMFTGEIKPLTASEIFTELAKLIDKYNLTEIYAYNVDYDINALNNLFKRYRRKHGFDRAAAEKVCALAPKDIMAAAVYAFCGPRKYLKFAKENGGINPNNNVRYGAEIMYRYLFDLPEFVEEHKGIDDAIIEAEILVKIWKRKKKVHADPAPPYFYSTVNALCKHDNGKRRGRPRKYA